MPGILDWRQVERSEKSYQFQDKVCNYLVYRIDKLPDFTAPRFSYLASEVDNRPAEVVKKQMNMIREFHTLGSDWAISFRLVKEENDLSIYLVFRHAGTQGFSQDETERARNRIQNALMRNEYTFMQEDNLSACLEMPWANEAVVLQKEWKEYQGDRYPTGDCQQFFIPFLWTAADNSMERICNALINHSGHAVAEATLVPTQYLQAEQQWADGNIRNLKDCMNGESIRDASGRELWKGEKLPALKLPLDNLEKMNKQYDGFQLFLSSVRVYSDYGADELAYALMANSVKNEGVIRLFSKSSNPRIFDYLVERYTTVDISAQLPVRYWEERKEQAAFRAQRMEFLVSVEEASNFFRIPVPLRAGFPGFGFDTGIEGSEKKKDSQNPITLGTYLDSSGMGSEPAAFDRQQFAKHGLIVGVPGSGKTTAMFSILHQLWDAPEAQRTPFIVLEPAKTEYRALKTLDLFKDDMLVFTLGDESVSPFRFNPMQVLPGIRLESHISKLQACFVGAFDLFDPLPIFLEQAIRRTYLEKGWYDDSCGGDPGLETPTLSDLCRNAEYIVSHSGFDAKMRSDFQASLLERLNSLRRGSKGRMLDTRNTIPAQDLMQRPVVLELDSLNGDEKSLLMMFLLTYVYEYCKVNRNSGSPLKHMLFVEEAHNLISAPGPGNNNRADPKAQTIELFVNMLAEMRALGQGIMIADQLPTAIAPQAVKQTNVKVLLRVTAKDDREEIGNTMDLNEEQMHQVVNFKTGHAYLYHEGEDRVRTIRMLNFKGSNQIEEPPIDYDLKHLMSGYENSHPELYLPYPECSKVCTTCNRRARNQAESFLRETLQKQNGKDIYNRMFPHADAEELKVYRKTLNVSGITYLLTKKEKARLKDRYGAVGDCFASCVYTQMINNYSELLNSEDKTYWDKYADLSKEA